MPTKHNPREEHSKESKNEAMHFQGQNAILCEEPEQKEYGKWAQVEWVRPDLPFQRGDDEFEKEGDGLQHYKQQKYKCLCVKMVGWPASKEVNNRLKSSSLVVQFHVRVDMVADAMHNLHLGIGKPSRKEEIFEVVCFVVNKVVTHPEHAHAQQTRHCTQQIRLKVASKQQ